MNNFLCYNTKEYILNSLKQDKWYIYNSNYDQNILNPKEINSKTYLLHFFCNLSWSSPQLTNIFSKQDKGMSFQGRRVEILAQESQLAQKNRWNK